MAINDEPIRLTGAQLDQEPPAAGRIEVRQRPDTICTADALAGTGDQAERQRGVTAAKACECQTRKALRRIREALGIALLGSPGRQIRWNEEIAALDDALSAPCPCEQLRERTIADYIDQNSVTCDCCQHIMIDVTAETMGKALSDAVDNEEKLKAALNADRSLLGEAREALEPFSRWCTVMSALLERDRQCGITRKGGRVDADVVLGGLGQILTRGDFQQAEAVILKIDAARKEQK